MRVPVFSGTAVREAVPPLEAYDAVRDGFVRHARGEWTIELADEDASPDFPGPPHSVLTEHLVDEPGSRTREALDLVLDHFRRKLVEPAGGSQAHQGYPCGPAGAVLHIWPPDRDRRSADGELTSCVC